MLVVLVVLVLAAVLIDAGTTPDDISAPVVKLKDSSGRIMPLAAHVCVRSVGVPLNKDTKAAKHSIHRLTSDEFLRRSVICDICCHSDTLKTLEIFRFKLGCAAL